MRGPAIPTKAAFALTESEAPWGTTAGSLTPRAVRRCGPADRAPAYGPPAAFVGSLLPDTKPVVGNVRRSTPVTPAATFGARDLGPRAGVAVDARSRGTR